MRSELTRRDFLKLASLLPLMQMQLPYFVGKVDGILQDSSRPNIFILVFDALSAEHMSLYGYRRHTTPNLDKLADRAIVYHDHYAGGNFTSAGTASLLTGTYPWSHRAFHLHGIVDQSYVHKNIFSAFARSGYHRSAYSHNLLATSLLYQFREDLEVFPRTRDLCLVDDEFADLVFPNDFNAAFWSEWLMMRGSNTPPGSLFISLLERFYRFYHKQDLTKKYGKLFPRGIPNLYNYYFILEDAINWIMHQFETMPRPFLAYYHLLPPHEPYTTRRDFVDLFNDGWTPEAKQENGFSEGNSENQLKRSRIEYDEYLAYADSEFGRLYNFMLQHKILDNTVFVFTSDHGEMFERGIRGHVTQTLYNPIIRVPLLITLPAQASRKDVFTSTSCVDLLPSLIDASGQKPVDWTEGVLLPELGGNEAASSHDIYSVEAKSNSTKGPLREASVALIKERYKITHYFGYKKHENSYEVYNLAEDPEERKDLFSQNLPVAKELKVLIDNKVARINSAHEI